MQWISRSARSNEANRVVHVYNQRNVHTYLRMLQTQAAAWGKKLMCSPHDARQYWHEETMVSGTVNLSFMQNENAICLPKHIKGSTERYLLGQSKICTFSG